MRRVTWDCGEIDEAHVPSVDDETGDPFRHIPPRVTFTPAMAEIADRYAAGNIDWRYYLAYQSATFLQPLTPAQHEKRRTRFSALKRQAESLGFQLPDSLIRLQESDEYVNRLRHNTIFPNLPEELWRLSADKEKMMFLVFSEGQGCCHWHLLLSPNHSHCVVCCDEAFGQPSVWPKGRIPDFSKYELTKCADSFSEWLCHFIRESTEHQQRYVQRLAEYFDETSGNAR